MFSHDLCSEAWTFRQAGAARQPWRPATVPGCVHRDLLRHKLIPDPFFGTNELELQWIENEDWEYRCSFKLPEGLRTQEHIELVAEGLDTVATVTLNGREVGRSENMFTTQRWDIAALLRPGRNDLVVHFGSALRYIRSRRPEHLPPVEFNDPVGGGTRLRKQACQFGWDWAPRLLTAGLWLPVRLEAWTGARLQTVRVTQDHSHKDEVIVALSPELVSSDGADATARLWCRARVQLDGATVAEGSGRASSTLRLRVPRPRLWWPAGQGEQTLYTVCVEIIDPAEARPRDTWTRRIGLRSIRLDRHKDEWGESFQFLVNGRPLFMKGANWIPAHSFVAGLQREDYERDLRSAVAANMNMLRVWGGGIYEHECFYDLCDELGLLVWQDFMFACTLYPYDQPFLDSVATEAAQQVERLRHRACLALWCGNNEIAQINPKALEHAPTREGYEALFHRLIPEIVARVDGVTDYWPSSAWGGRFGFTHEDSERQGDCHFWDVWHARKPVSDYEKWHFRFCSEFGMQSYASREALNAFAAAGERNLFGASAENHQKNPFGNQIILDYVSRRYGAPGSQDHLIYLSQLNQAHCMQVAVEHYRRNMPRCMGALYWQLNDCWPCASWSSLEHSGRWKALHHAARRFFAPFLLSAQVVGDERNGKGNYRESTHTGEVRLFTASDAPAAARGRIHWELFRIDTGESLRSGSKSVALRPGCSLEQLVLDFHHELAAHGRDRLVLRHRLEVGEAIVSGDSAFFAQPRFLALQPAHTHVMITMQGGKRAILRLRTDVYQHRLELEFRGLPFSASDNYIDLYPDEERVVAVDFSRPVTKERLKRLLAVRSLQDAQGG